jgi:single-strand DNA-binding protein
MNEPTLTIAGNLTADPELRYTPTGKPVTLLRVASTPRRQDGSGQWQDGTTTFLDAEVWNAPAENAAESLHRGDRVLLIGRVRTDVWTPESGPNAGAEQRRLRLVVDEVALSLRHATARSSRASRSTPSAGVGEDDASAS